MRISKSALWNLAVMVGCGIVLVSQRVHPVPPAPPPVPPLAVGERIGNASLLGVDQSAKSLILITSSTCHFCAESMPFYRRLSAHLRSHGTRIVGVSWEPQEANSAYLASNGVVIDGAVSAGQAGIEVVGTPTLILVNRNGIVLKAWSGKLDELAERDVLRAGSADN